MKKLIKLNHFYLDCYLNYFIMIVMSLSYILLTTFFISEASFSSKPFYLINESLFYENYFYQTNFLIRIYFVLFINFLIFINNKEGMQKTDLILESIYNKGLLYFGHIFSIIEIYFINLFIIFVTYISIILFIYPNFRLSMISYHLFLGYLLEGVIVIIITFILNTLINNYFSLFLSIIIYFSFYYLNTETKIIISNLIYPIYKLNGIFEIKYEYGIIYPILYVGIIFILGFILYFVKKNKK